MWDTYVADRAHGRPRAIPNVSGSVAFGAPCPVGLALVIFAPKGLLCRGVQESMLVSLWLAGWLLTGWVTKSVPGTTFWNTSQHNFMLN